MVFTMLGYGSIYYSTLQNEAAEKELDYLKAHWLAEAGVEKAKHRIEKDPFDLISPAVISTLGEGTYALESTKEPLAEEWNITSTGTVNGRSRTIEAVLAKYHVDKAIKSRGTINSNCTIAAPGYITGGSCSQKDYISFEDTFNGKTYADLYAQASANGLVYELDTYGDIVPEVRDVTIANLKNFNHYAPFNTQFQTGPALFIIDTTQVLPGTPTPKITLAGDEWEGIIWIIGKAEVHITTDLNGALFIDGDEANDTVVTTDGVASGIIFDKDMIKTVIGTFSPPILNNPPEIVSWQES